MRKGLILQWCSIGMFFAYNYCGTEQTSCVDGGLERNPAIGRMVGFRILIEKFIGIRYLMH
jgi:hypothetical protein